MMPRLLRMRREVSNICGVKGGDGCVLNMPLPPLLMHHPRRHHHTRRTSAGFGEVKKRLRTPGGGATGTVRNLRIREDTAKYLLNLDMNSAHYDPKSRSMREDPQPNKPANEKTFQGDNFVRKGGDFAAWQTMQMHSLEAFDKGQDVHMQANPSLAEMLYKQFKEKKGVLEKQVGRWEGELN